MPNQMLEYRKDNIPISCAQEAGPHENSENLAEGPELRRRKELGEAIDSYKNMASKMPGVEDAVNEA